MGIGYNMLSVGGKNNNKLHIQLQEPELNEGLWIKTELSTQNIVSMKHNEIKKQFASSWDIISTPSGYKTFAIVGDYIYLLGNTNGKYLKANLLENSYQWFDHTAGSSIEFTSTDVIGSIIYATHEGNSLNIYQMDTNDATPTFMKILPSIASFADPKICSYGNEIFAISGGVSGVQKIMRIDTSIANPTWEQFQSITEDTSMCSMIVNNDILYIIGVTYYGEKCYAIDLNDPYKNLNSISGFNNQGVILPALSNIGQKVRILNCGFADTTKNTLTLIDGIWKRANMTDMTELEEIGASYSRAYHTSYALLVKEYMEDNLIYRLRREYPSINLDDNTLILSKSDEGQFIDIGKFDQYNIKENIAGCYIYSTVNGLVKVPIAYFNEQTLLWEEISIDD